MIQMKWFLLIAIIFIVNINQVNAANLIDTTNPLQPRTSGSMTINSDGSVTIIAPTDYSYLYIRASNTGNKGALSRDLAVGEKLTVKIRAKSSSTASYIRSSHLNIPKTYFSQVNEYQDFVFNVTVKNHVTNKAFIGLFTTNTGESVTVENIDILEGEVFSIGNWNRTNPGAGGTINMIGATASGELITASDLSGIYINYDKNALHWDVLGEVNGLINPHISALGFHRTDGDTFYIGTGTGMYKTTNLGQSFNFISTSLTYDNTIYNNSASYDDNDTYVESIVVAKTEPNTVYVTYHKWDTNSSSSVAKSTDAGQTWTDVSFPPSLRANNLRIVKLLVHPLDANLIYAISGMTRWGCSAAKAYRSTNGGLTWVQLEDKGDVLDLDLAFDNTNILYMSTFTARVCDENTTIENYVLNEGDGHLYTSSNKGNTFGSSILNQTGIISVGTNDANNVKLINTLTLASAWWKGDNETGTWESNNAGSSWNHIGSVSNWSVGYANNPYSTYAGAFNGLNKTLIKDIFDSNRLYGAGGWTFGTFDGGVTFKSLSTTQVDITENTWISTGLENINGFALDVNDNNPNVVYMGGYDIGFWISKDRGLSWKWKYPFKDNLVTLNRYTWGAVSQEPESWEPESLKTIGGSNIMTLLSDPNNASVIWSSFAKAQSLDDAVIDTNDPTKSDRSGLFRSTDYGDTWTLSTIYNYNGTGLSQYRHTIIYGLSVDKSSNVGNRTLYVTIDGNVAKSTDNGSTWHIIHEDGGLKFTAVGNNVLYAGGKSGLWRYKNNNWTQMGGTLQTEMMGIGSPMIPDLTPQENITHYDENWNEIIDEYAWNGVHDIQIDPTNSDIVYVVVYGEGKGLYKTTNGGDTWARVDLGAFESKYLRYIAINPNNTNQIFVTSSENINSGGSGASSKGIFYTQDAGTTWKNATKNMVWKFGSKIKFDSINERIWAWSPGVGIQYTEISQ